MHVGALIFATDYAVLPQELARELEARGYESFFVPEHTHIPASRQSPWPGGADLPKEYVHTYDPFVALSFAAAATNRLRLGTGICLLPQRDTLVSKRPSTGEMHSNVCPSMAATRCPLMTARPSKAGNGGMAETSAVMGRAPKVNWLHANPVETPQNQPLLQPVALPLLACGHTTLLSVPAVLEQCDQGFLDPQVGQAAHAERHH